MSHQVDPIRISAEQVRGICDWPLQINVCQRHADRGYLLGGNENGLLSLRASDDIVFATPSFILFWSMALGVP